MRFKKYYYFSLFCCFGSIANAQFWGFSEPVKLNDQVNSPAEETTPWLVTKDGIKELYFVRTFDIRNTGGANDQDIWVSTQNANGFFQVTRKTMRPLLKSPR